MQVFCICLSEGHVNSYSVMITVGSKVLNALFRIPLWISLIFPLPGGRSFLPVCAQCGGVVQWILINNCLMQWHFFDWHSRHRARDTRNRRLAFLTPCHPFIAVTYSFSLFPTSPFYLSFFLSLIHAVSIFFSCLSLKKFSIKSIFCVNLTFMFISCVSSLLPFCLCFLSFV